MSDTPPLIVYRYRHIPFPYRVIEWYRDTGNDLRLDPPRYDMGHRLAFQARIAAGDAIGVAEVAQVAGYAEITCDNYCLIREARRLEGQNPRYAEDLSAIDEAYRACAAHILRTLCELLGAVGVRPEGIRELLHHLEVCPRPKKFLERWPCVKDRVLCDVAELVQRADRPRHARSLTDGPSTCEAHPVTEPFAMARELAALIPEVVSCCDRHLELGRTVALSIDRYPWKVRRDDCEAANRASAEAKDRLLLLAGTLGKADRDSSDVWRLLESLNSPMGFPRLWEHMKPKLLSLAARCQARAGTGSPAVAEDRPDPEPGPEWSEARSPTEWGKVFGGVSSQTMVKMFRDGKVEHKQLTTRLYMVAIVDLPSATKDEDRAKKQPAKS